MNSFLKKSYKIKILLIITLIVVFFIRNVYKNIIKKEKFTNKQENTSSIVKEYSEVSKKVIENNKYINFLNEKSVEFIDKNPEFTKLLMLMSNIKVNLSDKNDYNNLKHFIKSIEIYNWFEKLTINFLVENNSTNFTPISTDNFSKRVQAVTFPFYQNSILKIEVKNDKSYTTGIFKENIINKTLILELKNYDRIISIPIVNTLDKFLSDNLFNNFKNKNRNLTGVLKEYYDKYEKVFENQYNFRYYILNFIFYYSNNLVNHNNNIGGNTSIYNMNGYTHCDKIKNIKLKNVFKTYLDSFIHYNKDSYIKVNFSLSQYGQPLNYDLDNLMQRGWVNINAQGTISKVRGNREYKYHNSKVQKTLVKIASNINVKCTFYGGRSYRGIENKASHESWYKVLAGGYLGYEGERQAIIEISNLEVGRFYDITLISHETMPENKNMPDSTTYYLKEGITYYSKNVTLTHSINGTNPTDLNGENPVATKTMRIKPSENRKIVIHYTGKCNGFMLNPVQRYIVEKQGLTLNSDITDTTIAKFNFTVENRNSSMNKNVINVPKKITGVHTKTVTHPTGIKGTFKSNSARVRDSISVNSMYNYISDQLSSFMFSSTFDDGECTISNLNPNCLYGLRIYVHDSRKAHTTTMKTSTFIVNNNHIRINRATESRTNPKRYELGFKNMLVKSSNDGKIVIKYIGIFSALWITTSNNPLIIFKETNKINAKTSLKFIEGTNESFSTEILSSLTLLKNIKTNEKKIIHVHNIKEDTYFLKRQKNIKVKTLTELFIQNKIDTSNEKMLKEHKKTLDFFSTKFKTKRLKGVTDVFNLHKDMFL
jgi:hypothetical protein